MHTANPPDQLKAGEPVTLTLAIVADGLAAEQLPKLDVQAPTGIRLTPTSRNCVMTQAMMVVGYVRKNGWWLPPITANTPFPGLTLDWFNTKTGKQETAKVDPVKLVVSGGQAAPSGTSPQQPASQPSVPQPEPQPAAAVTDTANKAGSWLSWMSPQWYMSALLLWVVLTIVWLAWRWWQKFRWGCASGATRCCQRQKAGCQNGFAAAGAGLPAEPATTGA